jgi:hypothetical protein
MAVFQLFEIVNLEVVYGNRDGFVFFIGQNQVEGCIDM